MIEAGLTAPTQVPSNDGPMGMVGFAGSLVHAADAPSTIAARMNAGILEVAATG
jgi:hypothetical protein